MRIWNWSFRFSQTSCDTSAVKIWIIASYKIISYRTYKHFNEKKIKDLFLSFLNELEMSDLSVDVFKMIFLNILNSFARVRKKYFRANHSKFVNKDFNKTMMQRTELRNKFLKQKTTESKLACWTKKYLRKYSS